MLQYCDSIISSCVTSSNARSCDVCTQQTLENCGWEVLEAQAGVSIVAKSSAYLGKNVKIKNDTSTREIKLDDSNIREAMLLSTGLCINSAVWTGIPGYCRFTFALEESDFKRALDCITKFKSIVANWNIVATWFPLFFTTLVAWNNFFIELQSDAATSNWKTNAGFLQAHSCILLTVCSSVWLVSAFRIWKSMNCVVEKLIKVIDSLKYVIETEFWEQWVLRNGSQIRLFGCLCIAFLNKHFCQHLQLKNIISIFFSFPVYLNVTFYNPKCRILLEIHFILLKLLDWLIFLIYH